MQELDYSERWDAYYCKHCNIWSEKICTDPNCFFCDERPDRPIRNHYNPKKPNVVIDKWQ